MWTCTINYMSFQPLPPFMLNFISLPNIMTMMSIALPWSLHLPANPYHLSVHPASGLSCRLQLYPIENPTFL